MAFVIITLNFVKKMSLKFLIPCIALKFRPRFLHYTVLHEKYILRYLQNEDDSHD